MEYVIGGLVVFVALVTWGAILNNNDKRKQEIIELNKHAKAIAKARKERRSQINAAKNGKTIHPNVWNTLTYQERKEIRAYRKWNKRGA